MQITRNFKEHAYFMCSPGKAYQNALSNLNDWVSARHERRVCLQWSGVAEDREEVAMEVFRISTWEAALWSSIVRSLLILYSVTYQLLIENLLSAKQAAQREWIRCCPYSHGADRTAILNISQALKRINKWKQAEVPCRYSSYRGTHSCRQVTAFHRADLTKFTMLLLRWTQGDCDCVWESGCVCARRGGEGEKLK